MAIGELQEEPNSNQIDHWLDNVLENLAACST